MHVFLLYFFTFLGKHEDRKEASDKTAKQSFQRKIAFWINNMFCTENLAAWTSLLQLKIWVKLTHLWNILEYLENCPFLESNCPKSVQKASIHFFVFGHMAPFHLLLPKWDTIISLLFLFLLLPLKLLGVTRLPFLSDVQENRIILGFNSFLSSYSTQKFLSIFWAQKEHCQNYIFWGNLGLL